MVGQRGGVGEWGWDEANRESEREREREEKLTSGAYICD
jgi:hypothetical protein